MISTVFDDAFGVVAEKPFRLWGVSLLASLLSFIVSCAFLAIPVAAIAINLALSTSMTMIFLFGYRGKTPVAADLFECLKDAKTAKRVIGGLLWMNLWIFLWSLIPVAGFVFAIVKSYSYRLTPYILVLEDNVKITDAYKVSEQRTKGFKGEMFGADILAGLMFYGIVLLCSLISPVLGIIALLISSVIFPLFIGLVQAAFYEEIMNGEHSHIGGVYHDETISAASQALNGESTSQSAQNEETPAEENAPVEEITENTNEL